MTKERYLFRGFHKEENGKETIYIDNFPIKGKWVEGYYSKTDLGMFINQYRVDYEDECTYCEDFEVIPETIGQYCGLEDKNGKKIFENDWVILSYKSKEMYPQELTISGKIELEPLGIYLNTYSEYQNYIYDLLSAFSLSEMSKCLEVYSTIFDKEVNDNE